MCAYIRKSPTGFRKQRNKRFRRFLAATCLTLLVHSDPFAGGSGGLFLAGNELYNRGLFVQAATVYRQSIEDGANSSLAYFNMGNCYYQMNMPSKALGCYRLAADEAPGFFPAYLNLGVIYQMQQDWPAAISVLEIADAIEPDNRQVVLILAVAYRNLKAYAPAVRFIERAIDRDSTLYDCYFLLFDIYQELEDVNSAAGSLARYPDTAGRAAEKYHLLAGIAERGGEFEKSIVLYRKEIELAPDSKTAYYSLVNALNKGDHGVMALETARDALRRFDNYANLALLAAGIAFERKYMREADEFYRKAYALGDARGLIGLQNITKARGGERGN